MQIKYNILCPIWLGINHSRRTLSTADSSELFTVCHLWRNYFAWWNVLRWTRYHTSSFWGGKHHQTARQDSRVWSYCAVPWRKETDQHYCGLQRHILTSRKEPKKSTQKKEKKKKKPLPHSSGAVWESRWPSWVVRPNEPSGFRGRKELLNRASALVTTCP